MPSNTFSINNEFDQLTHVIMGTSRGYHRDPARVEVVNDTQQHTLDTVGHPSERHLESEFAIFRSALEDYGIQVYQPVLAPDSVQDQTCPRDIGFIIGDALIVSNMRNQSRNLEFEGVRHFIAQWDGRIILVPDSIYLEGGDVIIDGHRVFVGSGQRSSPQAAQFIQKNFDKNFDVIPMPCTSTRDGEDILHLDCAFNILGLGHVLIYPPGLVSIPDIVRDQYDWIEVTRSEVAALAINIMSIKPDTIIARNNPACARVNNILKKLGYKVIETTFDAVPATGGSFRCATLPLRRIKIDNETKI